MRVAELVEKGRFELREADLPQPRPGEVLARVHSVGICGSDLHNFSEGSVGDMPSRYPMVLGHEPVGLVVACGAGVTGWSPGDRVALEPAIYCYHCEYCQRGRHNVCASLRFMSQPGDPGFFRDYVTLPAENLLPLPAEMDFGEATLFEPLAVVLHSLELAAFRVGETAAVFGGGPIGLLTVASLRLAGASRIWCVEPVAHRRELALQCGADAVIDPRAESPSRRIVADSGGRGVDASFDCATKDDTVNECGLATRRAGRVVVTGIPSEVLTPLNLHELRRKEIPLLHVRRSNYNSHDALEMLRLHPGQFRPMLTHTMELASIQQAFETLEQYADGVGKIVIRLEPPQ